MVSGTKKKSTTDVLELPVEFGNISIGSETAKLSVKINKERLNINAAEELLCGRRLSGSVQLGGADDSNGQSKLFEVDVTVDGTFDIHRFGVGPKEYTSGLTFKIAEIEIGDLAQFSKGKGRLLVESNIEIPHDVADDDDENETNQTLPGTFKSDLPWRKVSMDTLFRGAILKALKGAGIATVGDYADFFEPSKSGYSKTLAQDVKGLGPAKITEVENRMEEFFRDNPQD